MAIYILIISSANREDTKKISSSKQLCQPPDNPIQSLCSQISLHAEGFCLRLEAAKKVKFS